MDSSDYDFQVEKLRDYVKKGGDPDFWLESKDFTAEQKMEIEKRIKAGPVTTDF